MPTLACDVALHVSLSLDDADHDGQIAPARGERATLLAAAVWRDGEIWHSAVLLVDFDSSGRATLRWRQDSSTSPDLGRLTSPPARLRAPRTSANGGDTVVIANGWPFATGAATQAAEGTLLQFDAATGRSLPPLLHIEARLVSGVATVDGDGDGVTDRLYVADAAWRVWRLDRRLSSGAPASPFTVSLFADLSAMAVSGAALQVTPDVALMARGAERSLEVALGTSNAPEREAPGHWLFVLRDALPGAAGNLATPSPIRPPELLRVEQTTAIDADVPAPVRGIVVRLPGALSSPVLTVAGHRIVVTRARETRGCPLRVDETQPLEVTSLSPEWLVRHEHDRGGTRCRALLVRREGADSAAPVLECRLGSAVLSQCPSIPSVRRDYWLRRDAQ